MQRRDVIISSVVVVTVLGIGIADFAIKEWPERQAEMQANQPVIEDPVPTPLDGTGSFVFSSSSSSALAAASQSTSSVPNVVRKGTKKKAAVNVDDVLASLNLIPTQTSEQSLLSLTLPTAKTMVLLQNNDRAGLLSWAEGDSIKAIFAALKEVLQSQFSGKLTDLLDDTRTPEDGPIFDILTFMDPAISPEKVTFIRVQNRLYEIHAAKEKQEMVDALVAALTK